MKITNLLESNMIKVPKDTADQLMAVVCSNLLSRIMNFLTKSEFDGDYDEQIMYYEKLHKQLEKRYGRITVNHRYVPEETQTIYLRMAEVDPRYTRRLPDSQKKKIHPISVEIYLDAGEIPHGTFLKKTRGRRAAIQIFLPNAKSIIQTAKSPELFAALLDRIEGITEHELMHKIQDVAFNEIGDTNAYYDADGKIIDDKYYTDKTEFHPQLITSAKVFAAELKDLAGMGVRLNSERIRQLFLTTVDPRERPPQGIQKQTLPYFATLFKLDKTKWKKAVKIFYGLVQDKLKE